MDIDIVIYLEVKKTGYASKQQCMNNVGAHHDLRLKAVKQQEEHHDDAARSDRGDAYQKPRHQTDQ